ncbi:MAG: zf-HC2 domain-containing protein [Sterolibacteriaceae bacterium]|nr:zf-HC2 domain-containing protein [Sterolibacteriaceae bacterium]MBK9084479.1 zf-HC2 domain-containing protein [Sterolibacteriaceae bacterium]
MMSCREVTRLCSEAQERKLSPSERAHLWWHTRMCDGCRNFRVQMDLLRLAARRFREGMRDDGRR